MTYHEDSAILTTIARQQILLWEEMSVFKENMGPLLYKLLEGQNYMKNKMMLMKEGPRSRVCAR